MLISRLATAKERRLAGAFSIVLFLSLGCLIPAAYTPIAHSELTNQEKGLVFLTDVAGLDMTKYEAKLTSYSPNTLGDFADFIGYYNLTTETTNQVRAGIYFKDNKIVFCDIYPLKGNSIFFSQETTQAYSIASALDFLNKYEVFLGADYLQPMRDIIGAVPELKDTVLIQGDVKLTLNLRENNYTYFEWMKTVNGIDNTHNRFIVEFCNGSFRGFSDNWNRYPVGNANANVSKDEAIRLAEEQLYSNYSIVPTVGVTLYPRLTMELREGVLYPQWEMYIPLGYTYHNSLYVAHAYVWADTGEVQGLQLVTRLGVDTQPEEAPIIVPTPTPTAIVAPTASPSPQPTKTQTPQPTAIPTQPPTATPEPTASPTLQASNPPIPTLNTSLSPTVSPSVSSADNQDKTNALDSAYLVMVVGVCVGAAALVALALISRRRARANHQELPNCLNKVF